MDKQEFLKLLDKAVIEKDFKIFQQLETAAQEALERGDLETAAQRYNSLARVYKMISESQDSAMAADYYRIAANIYKEIGNKEKYIKSIENAIKFYEKDEEANMPWILLEIARCYGMIGKEKEKEKYLNKAISAGKKLEKEQPAVIASIYEEISDIYSKTNKEKYEKLLRKALTLFKKAHYDEEVARLYKKLGDEKSFKRVCKQLEEEKLASYEKEVKKGHYMLAGTELMNLGFFLYPYEKERAHKLLNKAFDSFMKEIGKNACSWDIVKFVSVAFIIKRDKEISEIIDNYPEDKKKLIQRTMNALNLLDKNKDMSIAELQAISEECYNYCDDIVDFLRNFRE